jgi:hypothetical protein
VALAEALDAGLAAAAENMVGCEKQLVRIAESLSKMATALEAARSERLVASLGAHRRAARACFSSARLTACLSVLWRERQCAAHQPAGLFLRRSGFMCR